jgi:hypothetical protein
MSNKSKRPKNQPAPKETPPAETPQAPSEPVNETVLVTEESQLDPSEIDPKIKKNVKANLAAKEAFDFISEECSEHTSNPRFWEVLKTEVLKKCGEHPPKPPRKKKEPPKEKVEPMSDERSKDFLKEEIPYWQHAGKNVAFVLRKDPEHLKKLANDPSPFQKNLRRFLARPTKK